MGRAAGANGWPARHLGLRPCGGTSSPASANVHVRATPGVLRPTVDTALHIRALRSAELSMLLFVSQAGMYLPPAAPPPPVAKDPMSFPPGLIPQLVKVRLPAMPTAQLATDIAFFAGRSQCYSREVHFIVLARLLKWDSIRKALLLSML